MSKPVVAIVGRPNVGKSTLFNTLAGERISIVKDTPGVTRDRIYAEVTWLNHEFTMIDTGGIEPDSSDIILSQMREQAEIAIATADVIIFLTDVRQGLQDADSKVADMLRRSGKPVVLVVNKVDSFEKFMPDVYEFYNLGIGEPFPVSSSSMLGLGDMLDEVVKYFPEYNPEEEKDDRPKIAVIGKPNVGKSSLINRLAQEERVIVSDIAGTTRDAIDMDIEYNGKEYVFIDTAGIRRKNKIKEEIERYSIIRAVTAVERADVCLIMIDATEGVTEQDAKIAGIAHDRGKGVIIAQTRQEAEDAVTDMMANAKFGKSGSTVVIEEFLTGPEVSVLAFTDGNVVKPMVSSMDHKRAGDNDTGLNTGGMGTIAPNPYYTAEIAEVCMKTIFLPTINAMNAEGRTFKGCLYFGLMLTPNGPKGIEYNCRFGDPETQVVLPLLESDLLTVMQATTDGTLTETEVKFADKHACCVITASAGYPESYKKGYKLSMSARAAAHTYVAGAKLEDGKLLTNGGRVTGTTAIAASLEEAIKEAYRLSDGVKFEGAYRRSDIGQRALQALK